MKKTIHESQKGLLFKNGKFVRILSAGTYRVRRGMEIEVLPVEAALSSKRISLDALLSREDVKKLVTVVTVEDAHLALHYVDGRFASVLVTGKHAFFREAGEHTFVTVDVSTPYVDESIPRYLFSKIPTALYTKAEIAEYERGRLYVGQKLEKLLMPGTYYFWRTVEMPRVEKVDVRLSTMTVSGQEMLTQDKVSLRINFVCHYRVTDCVRVATEIDDFEEQIRQCAQLALREYVGGLKLDDILENKEGLSSFVYERLKSREKSFFVEFADAGVKDIILPGEIREIMNTVLVAEKRAQANVITRREEVASTRSLLNTARLMDENQTLYRLKELETIERICENVGNVTLSGNGALLSQLATLLRGDAS